ncbi:F-box and leucine-rich repeat protein 13-like isoform X2 [Cydia strobilella]
MCADEPTILEFLNRDVLSIILDKLSTDDILGTITVSRKWRNAILEYLKGSHYCFEHYYLPRLHFVPRLLGLVSTNDVRGSRSTPFDTCLGDLRNFQTKIMELGPGIVKIILDCLNENSLKTITQNCPNLKELMVVAMQEHPTHKRFLRNATRQCEPLSFTEEVRQCLKELQLKRVMFIDCNIVTDEYVSEFLKSDSIEELVVTRSSSVEGDCLSCLSQKKENNLKSLRLVGCGLDYLDPAVANHLTKLTTLDLSNNSLELQYLPPLLEKMSNLEYLFLNCYPNADLGAGFVQSLSRLGRLKHLSLCWNDNVSDEWLEAVARGCPGLQTLDIETKTSGYRLDRATVTAAGILALCRAAPGLEHLGIAGNGDVTDATVADIAAACPKLESVDLRGCAKIAQNIDILTALAVPQRPAGPLRLRLARTAANTYQTQAPQGLIFDFVDAPRLFRLV